MNCSCIFPQKDGPKKSSAWRDGRKLDSLYQTWAHMIGRCYNQNNPAYKRYGGRGVGVCSQWQEDFYAFKEDIGARPEGKTMDRVDNSKGYCPHNIRWATAKEQASNRREATYIRKNKYGVRGVRTTRGGAYEVVVRIRSKKTYFGTYQTLEEAAKISEQVYKDKATLR
jgi:hypothetical protein